MGQHMSVPSRRLSLEELVRLQLSRRSGSGLASTADVLADVRKTLAARFVTDDEVVESIVRQATGKTMAVLFDHRSTGRSDGLRAG